MTSYAQRNDDFFRAEEFNNRLDNVIWGVIVTQDPTEPAPLGSGLLILTAAGAGYVAVKRRKTFKKGVAIMLAFSMLLGLTQCKKHLDVIETVDKGIPMTLDAYNGAKTVFNMSGDQLQIAWGTNEVIYVVCNGKCIGSVTNGAGGGGTFTGSVTDLTAGNTYTLHYYYVGTEQTIADNATSFTMTFSGQDGTLDNLGKYHIGYGTQTITYDGNPISAVAGLQSLVAIGYFDIAGMAEVGEKVYMYGDYINNKISINFATNAVTYSKADNLRDNYIGLGAVASGATCGKYVMLVPNHTDGTELLQTDITFVSKRTSATVKNVNTFKYGIVAGRYYCSEGNATSPIVLDVASYYPGTLRGLFTINAATKEAVHFSQGNLQYIGSAGDGSATNTGAYWQLASSQIEYFGNNGQKSSTIQLDRDMFCWGTSGYNHGAHFYRPWEGKPMAGHWSDYYYPYGANVNLYDENGTADWGYNKITNGGNDENQWRTLTWNEWRYVFLTRPNTTFEDGVHIGVPNARFIRGYVDGKSVIMIFPDSFKAPDGVSITLGNVNVTNATGGCTVTGDFRDKMEAAGVVFLVHLGRICDGDYDSAETDYWTSQKYTDQHKYVVEITNSNLNLGNGYYSPCFKNPVRLVKK